MARKTDEPAEQAREENPRQQSDQGDVQDAVAQVDEVVTTETEQGFRGSKVDPTPNENYTLDGVTSGAPTPETDENLAREAGSRKQFNI